MPLLSSAEEEEEAGEESKTSLNLKKRHETLDCNTQHPIHSSQLKTRKLACW